MGFLAKLFNRCFIYAENGRYFWVGGYAIELTPTVYRSDSLPVVIQE